MVILFLVAGIFPVKSDYASEPERDANPFPPWVLTLFPKNVDPWGRYATLEGHLLSKGGTATCEVWFVWDTSFHLFYSNYAHSTPHMVRDRIGKFGETITGLERGVTYHVRAVAYNGYFYDQGLDLIFTPGLPHVETLNATDVETTSARLNARLEENGGVECDVWFVYDTSPHNYYTDYRYRTEHIKMNTTGVFSQEIKNLKPGTKYYFRAVASNDVGTVDGFEKNFTTLAGENAPPYPPDKPHGPIWGRANVEYAYSTHAIDPDEDMLRYYFDWGDGSGEWSEWMESGKTVYAKHAWNKDGVYRIKVKVQDEFGQESEWSPTLNVTIESVPPDVEIIKPKNAIYIFDRKIMNSFSTVVIGKITIEVIANDSCSGVFYVEFYIDGVKKCNESEEPYECIWDERTFSKHTIMVRAYDRAGNMAEDEVKVRKFF